MTSCASRTTTGGSDAGATPGAAAIGGTAAGSSVACVLVTFDPEPKRLGLVIDAVLPQVDRLLVIDNGSRPERLAALRARADRLELIELGRNAGIAAAQNVGIARARQAAADYVLLLDHDSIPAADMVRTLRAAIERRRGEGARVAAAGPRYLDARQDNPPPFIRVEGLRVRRCACTSDADVVAVDYLIASGSLLPMEALEHVGPMAESLFIDYVDIEWGLRAKGLGWRSFGVCGARMAHDLGEEPIRFLGRALPLHSPLRHYYHFRNAVWLYLRAALPLHWKLADGWRLLLKFGFYTLFATPRLDHLRMMSLGVLDGVRGRMGAKSAAGPLPRG